MLLNTLENATITPEGQTQKSLLKDNVRTKNCNCGCTQENYFVKKKHKQ
jgi:hypothetical protein